MSLVNQMLKDLESRRAPEMGGEAVLRDLATSTPSSFQSRGVPMPLLVGGMIAAALAAAGTYWYVQREADIQPAADSVTVERVLSRTITANPESVDPQSAANTAKPEPPTRPPNNAPSAPTAPQRAPLAASPLPPVAAPVVSPPVQPAPHPARTAGAAPARPERTVPPAPAAVMERVARPQSLQEKAHAAYLRGAGWVKRGRLTEAETALREALVLDPDAVDAREVLAAVLLREQRSPEAERVLQAGLVRNPRAYVLARMQARILADRNEAPAAIRTLETALPAPALDPDYYALLAALYQRTGAPHKAAEAYRRALAVVPERGVWWMGLGISLERVTEPAAALQAYRRARTASGMSAQLLNFVEGRIAVLSGES